ncbi:hypothetical protein HAX54_047222, partial [Datura stramonium]|nr:hypothetical protein [Datura stramonium]
GTAAVEGFLLQRDNGDGRCSALENLGCDCWNHCNDTIAAATGPLQRKCDRCSR